ncbi:MAG: UDP-N-acetylmuramoyl-L-alanine---L-glutamate ligase [Actinomycetota bacterium]|nr:UDP-N-acetylmuramoyl-L-alanine---L-glutamate ligase [Actinomycetota bacterium]
MSPVRRADLKGRVVALLGLGVDMSATLDAIVESEPGQLVAVDVDRERARRLLAEAGLGEVPVFEAVDGLPPADVAVRSPGFPLYSAALQDRVGRGMETVTPLGLWLAERGDRPTVALTGTKGKSTVSVLTTLALEHLGQSAVTVGNIGIGPWTLPPSSAETVVIEVSSYQAADLGCTPSIAALTSIGEDHLDWHGSVDRYHHDKARVFSAPGLGGRRWAGVLDDVALPPAFAAVDFCRVPVPGGGLRARNAHLAAATALAVWDETVDPVRVESVADALLAAYPELPGRFRLVATVDSVRYIDDALASNPLGLAASLGELGPEPLTVIVGGATRGADLEPVLVALAGRPGPTNVVCIDDAVPLEGQFVLLGARTYRSADLEAAVRTAAEITPAGGVVLFSPAMPTPPAEGNWSRRSARYQAEVERL